MNTTPVRARGPSASGERVEQHVAVHWWQDAATGDFQVWTGARLPPDLGGCDSTLHGALSALAPLLREHGWVLLVAGAHPDAAPGGPVCPGTHVRLQHDPDTPVHALDPLDDPPA